jgi:hypothetical protein
MKSLLASLALGLGLLMGADGRHARRTRRGSGRGPRPKPAPLKHLRPLAGRLLPWQLRRRSPSRSEPAAAARPPCPTRATPPG